MCTGAERAFGVFSGIGAGSKYGILFKGGVTIEALKMLKQWLWIKQVL